MWRPADELRPLAGNDTSPQIRNLVERLGDSSHCYCGHRRILRRLCSDYRVPALAWCDDCLGVARGQLSGFDAFSQLCGSDWYRREFRSKLCGRRCDWIRFAFRPLFAITRRLTILFREPLETGDYCP